MSPPGTDTAPGAGILANPGQREAGTLLSWVLDDSVPGNLYHGRRGPCLCARTCASHKCLLGRGDLGLSGRRVPCPSPENSVWELVRSLPTGGQSCGRSAQGAVQRNQSIPTWALLCCQWDFPGKNTGVGCHFLLQRSREYCLLKSMRNHIHTAADHYDSVCESSLTLRPRRLQLKRSLCPWDSPGKSPAVGCHFLLWGIFLTQGSNPGLLHCGQILYSLSHRFSLQDVKPCRDLVM